MAKKILGQGTERVVFLWSITSGYLTHLKVL